MPKKGTGWRVSLAETEKPAIPDDCVADAGVFFIAQSNSCVCPGFILSQLSGRGFRSLFLVRWFEDKHQGRPLAIGFSYSSLLKAKSDRNARPIQDLGGFRDL